MAFCTNCGTNVPDGIKFCTSCGTPMSVQAQPQAPPPPQQTYVQPQPAPQPLPQQAYAPLIIWACGGCQKVNKANFARAMLIMMIIGSVLSLLMFFAVRMLFGSEIDSLMEAFGDLLK